VISVSYGIPAWSAPPDVQEALLAIHAEQIDRQQEADLHARLAAATRR